MVRPILCPANCAYAKSASHAKPDNEPGAHLGHPSLRRGTICEVSDVAITTLFTNDLREYGVEVPADILCRAGKPGRPCILVDPERGIVWFMYTFKGKNPMTLPPAIRRWLVPVGGDPALFNAANHVHSCPEWRTPSRKPQWILLRPHVLGPDHKFTLYTSDTMREGAWIEPEVMTRLEANAVELDTDWMEDLEQGPQFANAVLHSLVVSKPKSRAWSRGSGFTGWASSSRIKNGARTVGRSNVEAASSWRSTTAPLRNILKTSGVFPVPPPSLSAARRPPSTCTNSFAALSSVVE